MVVIDLAKNYTISLERSVDGLEVYEERDQNIARVRVQLPTGEVVADPRYRVELTLSKDAMLGLGTELIRLAVEGGDIKGVYHVHPIERDFASAVLGIFIVPESCELLVAHDDFGTIEEIQSNKRGRRD